MADTLSPAQLERVLSDPIATESHSACFGQPALVVDLAQPSSGSWERLAELPAVSVGAGSPGAPRGLATAVDVVASSPEELAEILATVEGSPLASLALVQLLRQSRRRSIEDGLLAESLAYSTLQAGPEFAAWRARRTLPSREPNPEPAVLLLRDGERLRLELNRPEKRNAFSAEMRDALCEALALVLHDPSLRRVELCGAGPSFCSGGDLDEFGTLPDPATAHAIRSTRNAAARLARAADRVEARVHGACVGAGVELPAFCHRVTADPGAFFLLPEVGMGLVPGAGGTVSLPRRIGAQRTAWLALTRRRLPAETALAWGLVDEIRERGR